MPPFSSRFVPQRQLDANAERPNCPLDVPEELAQLNERVKSLIDAWARASSVGFRGREHKSTLAMIGSRISSFIARELR